MVNIVIYISREGFYVRENHDNRWYAFKFGFHKTTGSLWLEDIQLLRNTCDLRDLYNVGLF